MRFEIVAAGLRRQGPAHAWCPPAQPDVVFECDEVLIAVGQENAFPWIERDSGIEFDEWGLPVLDADDLPVDRPRVFFGGDAAFGPEEHHHGGGARP